MATVKVPQVVWVLGDREQATGSGVTVETRPLYYRAPGTDRTVKVGTINPDYAEPLMKQLSKQRSQ